MKKTLIAAALVAVATCACGDDDGNNNGGGGVADAAIAFDAAPPDGAPVSDVCYPTGSYGVCDDVQCPMCLDGAGFYKTCAKSCTANADCGGPEDFNGASPLCAPINPGAMQMICVLTCTSADQCPCGLGCVPSGAGPMICATPTP